MFGSIHYYRLHALGPFITTFALCGNLLLQDGNSLYPCGRLRVKTLAFANVDPNSYIFSFHLQKNMINMVYNMTLISHTFVTPTPLTS
jgi:hypothetical protein